MSGKVFVAYTGDPQSAHELPAKQYMKAAYDSVSQLDNQHQTLTHDHGTTRAALQQLIAEVHGPRTTLADGAGEFDVVESKLEQYKTTTDSIETTLPSLVTKEELLTYITPGELSTTTVQTATHLSPGGTINGHAFTGQETITVDVISATTLQNAVASLVTKEELSTYVKSADLRAAAVQTVTHLSPGGTICGQSFTGSESITAHTLTAGLHLSGDPYNGDTDRIWSVNASVDATANTIPVRTSAGDIKAVKFIGDLQGQADMAGNALNLGGQSESLFITHTQLDTALEAARETQEVAIPTARPNPPWQAGQIILSDRGLEVFDGAFWCAMGGPGTPVEWYQNYPNTIKLLPDGAFVSTAGDGTETQITKGNPYDGTMWGSGSVVTHTGGRFVFDGKPIEIPAGTRKLNLWGKTVHMRLSIASYASYGSFLYHWPSGITGSMDEFEDYPQIYVRFDSSSAGRKLTYYVRTPYSQYTMIGPSPPDNTVFLLTFAMSASQLIFLIDGNHVGGSPKTLQDTWNPPEGHSTLTKPMAIFDAKGLLFDLEVYDGVQNDAAIAAVKGRLDSV